MSRGARSGPELTPAQRALYEGEPTLPAEAAAAAIKGMGEARFRHLEWEDMVNTAAVAVMEAAATFDPERGLDYRTWAFFGATHAVIQSGRDEHARYSRAKAMLAATVLMHLRDARVELDVGFETESSLGNKLHACTNPVVALALLELAAAPAVGGGEDEALERLAAARAGEALREVRPPEGTEERQMLELHFEEGPPLTRVAATMGYESAPTSAGYRAFVRRFHGVLASLREGLARRGVHELPP